MWAVLTYVDLFYGTTIDFFEEMEGRGITI